MEKTKIGVAKSDFDADTAKAEIEKVIFDWSKALSKGDIIELGNLYSEDAKLMGHGRPSIEGRENILNELKKFIREKITGSSFVTLDVWGNTEILIEEGTGTFSHENGNIVSRGKISSGLEKG